MGGNLGEDSRRVAVKTDYAILQIDVKKGFGRKQQLLPAGSMLEQFNSIKYFRLCDRCGVELNQRVFVKPRRDLGRWTVPHQLGQNIGVKDDHSAKSGGLRMGSRGGNSSSTPPRGANRRRTMSARLRLGWVTSADRRISLASSSIERP